LKLTRDALGERASIHPILATIVYLSDSPFKKFSLADLGLLIPGRSNPTPDPKTHLMTGARYFSIASPSSHLRF
jgi:hypothetical protein